MLSIVYYMSDNPIGMYDVTTPCDKLGFVQIRDAFNLYFKRWTFQQEKGKETGFLHWQIRGTLKTKKRFSQIKKKSPFLGHWSPTSNPTALTGDEFYVMKPDTRVDGPWSDRDKEVYIPRQYRGLMDRLYPYQKQIRDSMEEFDDRKLNFIFCFKGNNGKSTIAALMALFNGAVDMPPCNDFDKLIYSLCDIIGPKGRKERKPKGIFIDLPRATDKKRLYGLYSAMEQIKKGKVFDLRYKYEEWWFDSPAIWCFSNRPPNIKMMSLDRWNLWMINDKKELVPLPVEEPNYESSDDDEY